jgi:uncharacterized membrane-anchored protein YjiN (DUF445 family)
MDHGIDKARQLKKHKTIATACFLAMAVIYIVCAWNLKHHPATWVGYISAFSEAAMVGALADWFAVTALFHHPLRLKIPHTNLIEKRKQDIGNNLGDFVVENFLTPAAMRPYIEKIKLSGILGKWLENEKNRTLLKKEIAAIATDIVQKSNDEAVISFITQKGATLISKTELNKLGASVLEFILKRSDHEKIVTFLLGKLKYYIAENEDMIRERVKKESGFLMPGFVDNIIANRVTVGLANYVHEIEQDKNHRIRQEITQQLHQLSQQLREGTRWKSDIEEIKTALLDQVNIKSYARDIWTTIKEFLTKELSSEDPALLNHLDKPILDFSIKLGTNKELQDKIDHIARLNAYRIILKNKSTVGNMISQTVGQWEGRELSQKLELEVGKDLQFIRINGTIIGGLVGLLIYTLSMLL